MGSMGVAEVMEKRPDSTAERRDSGSRLGLPRETVNDRQPDATPGRADGRLDSAATAQGRPIGRSTALIHRAQRPPGKPEWRQVAGVGFVYARAAIIGVAVGLLVRHTAGAVAMVLIWGLAAETVITAVPASARP